MLFAGEGIIDTSPPISRDTMVDAQKPKHAHLIVAKQLWPQRWAMAEKYCRFGVVTQEEQMDWCTMALQGILK